MKTATRKGQRGLVATLALIAGGGFGPTPVSAQGTHLNVVPGRFVQLAKRTVKGGPCNQDARDNFELVRVKSDGGFYDNAFSVPSGKVFIVTDISWAALPRVKNSFTAGQALEPRLLSYRGSDQNTQQLTYQLPPLLIPPNAENSILGEHVSMTAGVVVKGGRRLCFDVQRVTPGESRNDWVEDVRIIGYVAELP